MAEEVVNMFVIAVSLLISGIRQVEVIQRRNIASAYMNPVFAPTNNKL
jgi:hypothetical protein